MQKDPYFARMNLVKVNYLPLSAEDLAREATLIVSGTLASAGDGRTLDFAKGPSNPIPTAVFKFAVERVLKGDADAVGSHVYFDGLPITRVPSG